MSITLSKIDRERATQEALILFSDKTKTDIDKHTHLSGNPPWWLRYTTQLAFDGLSLTSYARMVMVDPTIQLPQGPGFQDGIQYPLEGDEIAVRDFTMDHNPFKSVSKVYSGLHVRPEFSNQGIGSFLIGLSNHIIEDMIARFLVDMPENKVYALIVDASHSNGTNLNRNGWTSYQAKKLGFRQLSTKKTLTSFMKRFPVKQILASSANS